MSTVNVTGYYDDGVAYGVTLDSESSVALSGVITAGQPDLISAIEAATGEPGRLHPTGGDIAIGVDTIDGVLAYLLTRTEVVDVTGDLPDAMGDDSAIGEPVDH